MQTCYWNEEGRGSIIRSYPLGNFRHSRVASLALELWGGCAPQRDHERPSPELSPASPRRPKYLHIINLLHYACCPEWRAGQRLGSSQSFFSTPRSSSSSIIVDSVRCSSAALIRRSFAQHATTMFFAHLVVIPAFRQRCVYDSLLIGDRLRAYYQACATEQLPPRLLAVFKKLHEDKRKLTRPRPAYIRPEGNNKHR